MANASIDGLVSGLDTSGIISQLMQLERIPVARLEQKRNTATAIATAYQTINTKFLSLQSSADKLTKADLWNSRKATSSSTNVAVSAAKGALAGSFTFDVEQVAAAQSYVSDLTYSSTAAPLTASATIAITKGAGAPVVVDVGDGSLAAVVAGINASSAGVRAAATQVSPGVYRLQLSSTTTGLASDFTITDGVDTGNTSPLGVLDELVAGADARIAVGDALAPGRYTVTSSSNTLADVMPGVTVTVKGEEVGVTVDVVADVDAIAADVEAMVTAANSVLSEMKKYTAYDAVTKKGGVLTGDSTVRGLQQEVLRLAAQAAGGVGTANAAEAGVELNKDGTLTFTKATFVDAFNEDPAGTAALFRPGGSTAAGTSVDAGLHPLISLSLPDDRTVPGTYEVKVTAAATQAKVVVTGTVADGDELTLTVPGKDPLVVTAGPGDDLAALAVKINTESATAAFGLVAVVESGELVVRTAGYGSNPSFTLTSSNVALVAGPFQAGVDVAGSINGVVATGVGQLLNAPVGDKTLWGLSLRIDATDADVAAAGPTNVFGTYTYAPGLAQRLDSLAGNVVRSGTGVLTTAIAGRNSLIENLEDQITSWEPRLELKENALRRQYSGLERSLGTLKSQSAWLSGQISGLMANNG